MKHKKDVPLDFRKYVKWQLTHPGMECPMLYESKREAFAYSAPRFTVKPVLCLPLADIDTFCGGYPHFKILVLNPLHRDSPL